MTPRRKPGIRAAREVATALRDLVADFCRRHGGELHPTRDERVTTPDGIYGATWVVPTRVGAWLVHEPCDPSAVPLISINTRFIEPARARGVVGATVDGATMNPYSGKWNHNWSVEDVTQTPAQTARGLLDAFAHLAAPFVQPTSHAATGAPAVLGAPYQGGPTTATRVATIYLRHESGATHALRGRNLAKLRRAVLDGAAQPEIVRLIDDGYTGWIGDDGAEWAIDAIDRAFDGADLKPEAL